MSAWPSQYRHCEHWRSTVAVPLRSAVVAVIDTEVPSTGIPAPRFHADGAQVNE